MFAKPFLGQLGEGHVQGVYSMCKVCSRPARYCVEVTLTIHRTSTP